MSYNVAVVGATGAVGREMLQTLFENFQLKYLCFGSRSSVGKEVSFGDDKILKVSAVDDLTLKADIGLSAGSDIAKKFGAKQELKVVLLLTIPLVLGWMTKSHIVPEVNPEAINGYKTKI